MPTNSFPQLDLRALSIRDQLENVSDKTLLGFCIRLSLQRDKPTRIIFKTIMDAYADNESLVLDVIPQETINQIKQLYGR